MLKPGQWVITNSGNILQIYETDGEGYICKYTSGQQSILAWFEFEFKQIAPEGFTLEEAKLYFAL